MKLLLGMMLFCASLFAVDINNASAEELMQLKGIGAAKTEMIVQYRSEHKCFKSKEELLKVKGIGKGLLQKNENMIELSQCK
ncbi:ComEA family DNA-binding protein [Candidatus Marinarcus aquaticus]|uniref:Competence protein ComEA n=1 Tax=Candidatus Marinarcus aquaticus TaxID=2044504 RepID=A0A4Q0XQN3_9BACT|nr:helix-hairpin-helix domain-containing protein [Candidatus Marinarcus aquaticus]RXJ54112.1 competence protein ComEA [Candidatus Marinarcus aquaticus]